MRHARRPRVVAWYLPQFHPTAENDAFWGPGFTDWRNVTQARPRFPGHDQPRKPTDLGYYDLRLTETRRQQADLARRYGVDAFCYYHYWFEGRDPLGEILRRRLTDGEPSLPFALCWANEDWTRSWGVSSREVLLRQTYGDDPEHFAALLPAFRHRDHLTVQGAPLFVVYRPSGLPDPPAFCATWRRLAVEAGLPGLHLAMVESGDRDGDPRDLGFDSTIGFLPPDPVPYTGERLLRREDDEVLTYGATVDAELDRLERPWPHAPAIMPQWDNTPRRATRARMYIDSTPEEFGRWAAGAAAAAKPLDPRDLDSAFLFVVAWNEWGEGNVLEPEERFGHRYGDALRAALDGATTAAAATTGGDERARYRYRFDPARGLANVLQLIGRPEPHRDVIIDVGAGYAPLLEEAAGLGWRYLAIDADQVAVDDVRRRGGFAVGLDLAAGNAEAAIATAVDSLPHGDSQPGSSVGAVLALDVLEHLVDPAAMLRILHTLCRDGAPLIISVPNVTHIDLAFQLLLGRFRYTRTGLLDATHLRFFDEVTLAALLDQCGFGSVERCDFEVTRSDQAPAELGLLPPDFVGMTTGLAEAFNPSSFVQQFIWRVLATHEPNSSVGFVVDPPATDPKLINEALARFRSRSAVRTAPSYEEAVYLRREVERLKAHVAAVTAEADERLHWARRLERERDEMTAWALQLQAAAASAPRAKLMAARLLRALRRRR